MKYLLFCILLLFGHLSLIAQHMFSGQFPFFNLLSSNEIFDIHQDREGYLWIATTNGLARYDGYRLVNFRSDYKNPDLLAGNYIRFLDDSDLYVWISTSEGLSLYDKQTCRIIPFSDARLQNKMISYVAVDYNGDTWVGADMKIYRCDAAATISREYDLLTPQGKNRYDINSIYIDKRGNVWVLSKGGIFKYDPVNDTFIHYPTYDLGETAFIMCEDASGNYWLGTWGTGLWQFFPDKRGQERYKQQPLINARNGAVEDIVFSIEQDDTFGYLWILSYGGLHTVKLTREGVPENINIDGLVDTQMMYSRMCKDKEGNLWLASFDKAYTIFFDKSNIKNYPLPQVKRQLGWDTNITNLYQDNDSVIWFNQDRSGLYLYDLSENLLADCRIGHVNLIIKSHHKPGVWVNSSNSPHVRRLTRKGLKVQIEETIHVGGVNNLLEDKDGNLWIYRWTNLNVKRPDNDTLVGSDREMPRMNLITADKEEEVWGVDYDSRIYRLKCTAGRVAYKAESRVPVMEKERINSVCIDRKGRLWLSTSLGRILKSDEAKQTFEHILPNQIIDDCSILGMLSDRNNVWIITNKKVIQYDIESQTFRNFSTADENILVDVFRYKAISLDEQGGLYVGGHQGLIHIQANNVSQKNVPVPHFHITDVRVEDKSLFFSDIQESGKNTIHKVFLKPDDRNIEVFFSPLLYSANSGWRIAYKLDGVDRDWVHTDSKRASAYYNNLPKGTYKFHIRIEYARDKWMEDKELLTIVKAPAFYETWYACLFYLILGGLCMYALTGLLIRYIKKKNDTKLQEELTRTKLVYFTNISHELLTPLTVISCISDYLEEKEPAVQQQSVMLKANVDKLKRLIQQVLDFRKLDVGKLKLHVSEGNISDFIRNICRINFLPLARKKNITLETRIDAKVQGYVDFDKLDKVMHNLLSNAIKYTPENKYIRVYIDVIDEAEHRMLVVKVQDEGIGISEKEIGHIFTCFYSSRKKRGIDSNGIGLSVTKDMVNLHHGTIIVDSVVGQGTCFTVKLPIDKESYTADELAGEAIDLQTCPDNTGIEDSVSPDHGEKPTILLIDDNTELLFVMKETFSSRYMVLTAVDGKSAWDKLTNNEVDVVICDVILPDSNGWEICKRIKNDLRFNHIPVIILTAKNGMDDRIASYDAGADGFIAKPFELKILFARVDNLIRSSRIRQAAFRKEEEIDLEALAYPSADKKFLQSIIDSIEQHLEESEFDLEKLSADINVSKSTLYRKIKSTTGMTPIDFVRNIKMKRACMMLLSRKKNISEVAYSLGFSSPKYFTRCFKEVFDITPSEFLQKHGN